MGVHTPLLEQFKMEAPETYHHIVAAAKARTALGGMATAQEVATVAVFLAGGGSTFITGTVINVDGGWTAT